MIKRSDKRAQGLSTNAIILMVLGVFILAIMIFGFTLGWSKIAPWLSSENVDTIVNSCEAACSTQSIFGYCSKVMELSDGEKDFSDTCFNFAKTENAEKYGVYGIKDCPGLCAEIPAQ